MNTCPECESSVTVPTDAVEGEIVACNSCSAELELLALDPVDLALAPELAEDWGE
ncbi:MAG: lysine biosynthesis protein LysW [Planctomycetota bacterium]|nr:MAG: lysine biosynthesis protein LysW [Planctomycetota bacterium]